MNRGERALHGEFQPVLAKHSKHFNIIDALSHGVDRMIHIGVGSGILYPCQYH